MLELKELYKTFNPGTINAKTALSGLNVTLNDGDFVTVIGGNGAGKSTMLNATAGTFFVDSGKVIIDGADVTNLPERRPHRPRLSGPDDGHGPLDADRRKPCPRRPPRPAPRACLGRDKGRKRAVPQAAR